MLDNLENITVPDLDDPLFAEFWQGMRHGELRIQYCAASDTHYWPPRHRCTRSGSTDMTWKTVPAKGTLFSYVVVSKSMINGFEAPYTIGLISLDDPPGIRIVGILLDASEGGLLLGTRVEGVFRSSGPQNAFTLLQWKSIQS